MWAFLQQLIQVVKKLPIMGSEGLLSCSQKLAMDPISLPPSLHFHSLTAKTNLFYSMWAFLQHLIQLVKKLPVMGSEGLSSCSQKLAMDPILIQFSLVYISVTH
jgi:hypothetical protein